MKHLLSKTYSKEKEADREEDPHPLGTSSWAYNLVNCMVPYFSPAATSAVASR